MNREKVKQFVEKSSVQNFIIALIIFNSITIGMETSSKIMNSFGRTLLLIDKIILAIFVLEITLKLICLWILHSLKAAGMFLIFQL